MIDRPLFKLPVATSEGRVAAILGACLFAVYAAGACRTIFVGDSGELVAAVHVLGIPHPSSYPLYVLLGKLWTILLPVGSIAFRMSLFSAAFAAATCVVLYRVAREAGLRILASIFSALLLAFSPTFWAEANVQRVYSLNTFFVALATLLAFRWHRTRRPRDMALTFFVCGLGGTNHTVMLIYAVAFALFVVLTIRLRQGYGETSPKLEERRRAPSIVLNPKTLASSAVALIAGLLPYAYLPLRSRADPPVDWQNPESLENFLAVVLRRDFWERRWFEGPADFVPIAVDYMRGLAVDFAWVGLALGVVGLVSAWRRRWPVALVVLVIAGNVLAVALHGSRSDIFIWHRYYLPSYVIVALLAGLGCQLVVERLPRFLTLLPLTVPMFLLVNGYQAHDRSRFRIAEDFSRLALGSVSPGAHLIASDDNILFVLMYLSFVEEARPDVDLVLEGVGGSLPPSLTFNPDNDPLFLTHYPNWSVKGLEIVPVGLVFQTWREGRRRTRPRHRSMAPRRGARSPRAEGLPDQEPDRSVPLHAGRHPSTRRLAGGAAAV